MLPCQKNRFHSQKLLFVEGPSIRPKYFDHNIYFSCSKNTYGRIILKSKKIRNCKATVWSYFWMPFNNTVAVSICTRILKYRVWKIKFDELDFLSISNSNFAGYTGSKNLDQTRQKFQFIKLDFSNSIFQNPSADRYRDIYGNIIWHVCMYICKM